MIANYHTHTKRCGHAEGEEREYIEEAIRGGYRILGFADHTPYPFPADYHSGIRMGVDELEDYVTTLTDLQKEYEKDIRIEIGLEVEYYPAYFDALLEVTHAYPIRYFLLGQHFMGNEIGESHVSHEITDVKELQRYYAQVAEAMRTGRFLYVAHPDLIHFTGEEDAFRTEARKICQLAKELHIPLEINFLGLYEGRNYPNPLFWQIVSETGNDVVFGADAHKPAMTVNPVAERMAREMASRLHLHVLEELPL